MTKSYFHLFVFAILSITVISCSKELELKDPQGLDPSNALSNDGNVKKVLQGAYDAISSTSLYGGDIQLYADLMGSNGDLNWVGTFNNYREVWGKNILTTNTLITETWAAGYNAINTANTVLANLSVVNADDVDAVKGEALFIRGLVHFDLVRLYAKDYKDGDATANPGVPIMTTPENNLEAITKPARSSVKAVYDAVIADLTEAEALLPKTNDVFATKAAASAVLSRVYLQKGDYAGARDAADSAIRTFTGNLLPDFMSNFNKDDNTAEDIFAIQVSDQDGSNGLQLYYSISDFGARDGDIEVNEKMLDIYQDDDARVSVTDEPEDAAFETAFYYLYDAYRTTKFRDLYKNVKVIRLAEMYLTRAEANYRLGTATGAKPVDDINKIRNRAGLQSISTIGSLDDFYWERHRELAFEGFALHDAKRFKKSIDGLVWNDNSLVLPIPFRELNANSSLEQNPGY